MRPLVRMSLSLALALVFAASLLSLPVPARASEDQAKQRLFALIDALKEKYPALRDRRAFGLGSLEQGKSAIYNEQFQAGVTYLVVAVGCDTAQDIDIGIGDSKGNMLASDTENDAAPVVVFEPTRSATYVVAVNMAQTTSGDVAHYAYQVFYVDSER